MIWPIIYFTKVVNAMAKNGKSVSLWAAFLLWFNNLIDLAINSVIAVVKGLLSLLNISAFENTSLGSIPGMGYMNAVFPVSEFIALTTIFFTAWGLLIVIRWTKSFIPTIGN